ncbi:MAG TPA: hypothetical protein ENI73_03070 [Spirochaetes bacterium]|nr:hypothetical protein [Spirochaetota bacterium]
MKMTKVIVSATLLAIVFNLNLFSKKGIHYFKPAKKLHLTLGILVKNKPKGLLNPSEYVLEDGYLYKGADYRVNGTNIVLTDKKNINNLAGKVVIIYYDIKKDLNKILEKKGKAPKDYGEQESMMQMREDWVSKETGFHIGHSTRKRLKTINYFKVIKIAHYPGFSTHEKKDSYQVNFTNYFNGSITGLEITAHYEGGTGKPSSKHVSVKKLKRLAKGGKMSVSINKLLNPGTKIKRKRAYRLNSVIISGKATYRDHFHFDVPIWLFVKRK